VQHHYKGHWKEWALKIKTFWALKWQRAKRVPFGPKKGVSEVSGKNKKEGVIIPDDNIT
jgi:hypothetical protein